MLTFVGLKVEKKKTTTDWWVEPTPSEFWKNWGENLKKIFELPPPRQ